MTPYSFRQPLRFLRGHGARLVLTVIALALGVALVSSTDLVNRAVLRAFLESVDALSGRAALQIRAGEGGLFSEDIVDVVAAVPGVRLAVPAVSGTAFTSDERGELLMLHGIDVTDERAVRVYDTGGADNAEIEDPLVFLSRPDSVVLTRTFSERHGLRVNDQIELETPTGRHRFTVRGLMEPAGIARVLGGNLVIMDLPAAERFFARDGFINRIDVVLAPGADAEAVGAAVRAAVPAGLDVETPVQRKSDLGRLTDAVRTILQGVSLLGLLAAFLIIFNRLSAVFEGRCWEIGILKVMGASRRAIWLELLTETLLLGLVGIIVGIPLGIVIARRLLPVIATTTSLGAKLAAPVAELRLSVASLVMAAVTGVGAATLAGALPAWRTAGTPAAEVLRGQHLDAQEWRWVGFVVRLAILAVLAATVSLHVKSRSSTWGLAGSAAAMTLIVLSARPIVQLCSRLVGTRSIPGIGPATRMAVGALERNRRRSAVTVATLAAGCGIVVWLWVLASSFEQSVTAAMPGIFKGDLVVGSARLGMGYVEASVDDRVLDEIGSVSGVSIVVGERALDWRYGGGPVAINAYDPAYFTDERFERWPLVGESLPNVWSGVARGDLVIVSTNLTHHQGLSVGDALTIDAPNGPLHARIGGVVQTFLSPRGTVLMSRDLLRKHWNDRQITHALLRVGDVEKVENVRAELGASLGRKLSLNILRVDELVEWFASQVRQAFFPLYVLGGIVLLVVGFGVADTLAAGTAERRRELATLGALGVRRSVLARIVLVEAAVLGTMGLVLAMAGGLGLGVLWVRETFPDLVGWTIALHVPLRHLAAAAGLTLLVCLVAAVTPSIGSSRLRLADALRYD